ncbi:MULTISPECIES: hypothetical protein [unclassified Nocardioides]|uniref:hypothetical protein n=1 Tax=unclassified Nocardioides TaxID=2615069 RepID=UPI003615E005
MITTDTHTTSTLPTRPSRPTRLRRTGVAVTAFLTCAMPTVFAFNLSRMLVTGELDEHRFHQLTGQGLLLCALWLGGIIPLVRAGWAGRRPSSAAGILHLAFMATGALTAAAATGGGAPALLGVIGVPGALLWLALPVRPQVRLPARIDPVLAPVALVAAAVWAPYAIDQIALQNAATGHHAQNPHYFDMAWMVATLVVVGLAGAILPAVRRLTLVAGGGLVWTGAMGVLLGVDRPWTPLMLGVGALMVLVSARRARR